MISTRRATAADCEQIARVHAASIRTLFRTHYSHEQLEPWAASITPARYAPFIDATDFFVAIDDEAIAGFTQMMDGEVHTLYIDPGYARRGIGTMLVRELERAARERGLAKMTLSASLNAAPFYEAMGFAARGESAWNGLKVVVMEKLLP